MAEEAFAGAGMGDDAAAEGTFFESVKTSLPGLGKPVVLTCVCPVFFRPTYMIQPWDGVYSLLNCRACRSR